MRRTENLNNPIYKRKYKEVYKLIYSSDLDVVNDQSNWKRKEEYLRNIHPLWIIIESSILNKRIWVTHSFDEYCITTAQLDLNIESNEYRESYTRQKFKNQKDLCQSLETLLHPCLEIRRELDKDITDEMY